MAEIYYSPKMNLEISEKHQGSRNMGKNRTSIFGNSKFEELEWENGEKGSSAMSTSHYSQRGYGASDDGTLKYGSYTHGGYNKVGNYGSREGAMREAERRHRNGEDD